MPLLLLLIGTAATIGCFFVPGWPGVAVAVIGVVALWCALLSGLKRGGWL